MDKYCLGVDVDKKCLKVCLVESSSAGIKVKGSRSFSNQPAGFSALLDWAFKKRKDATLTFSVVLEATGVYHEHFSYFMASHQVSVHLVLPSLSKHYMRSLGHRSKTDKLDAKGLAYMGCERVLDVWAVPSKSLVELRSLTRQVEALQQQKTMIKNQFEAFSHAHVVHKAALRSNQSVLATLKKEIAKLEKAIQKIVEKDEVLAAKYQHFSTLKGVGLMTFAVVASETNGFEFFSSQRQLTSYAGYDIVENQSGQRSGKTRISKKGSSHIRRILHLASWSAVRYEVGPFYQLYQRVYERTGIKSKAYVAVQRKLLMMIYTLWKKDEPFDPNHEISLPEKASGIQEPKPSLGGNGKINQKETATSMEVAALDRPLYNQIA